MRVATLGAPKQTAQQGSLLVSQTQQCALVDALQHPVAVGLGPAYQRAVAVRAESAPTILQSPVAARRAPVHTYNCNPTGTLSCTVEWSMLLRLLP